MNEWGNNPATYQAIGAIFSSIGIIAVIYYTYLTRNLFLETKAQRIAIEDEMNSRLRPWVGLFDCKYSESTIDELFLLIKNFGALPAQSASLKLELFNVITTEDGKEIFQETGVKVLMPNEEGNYNINLSNFPKYLQWKSTQSEIRIVGTYSYSLKDKKFETQFECLIRPNILASQGRSNNLNWRNQTSK
jgi:hypothetical protein